MTRTFSSQPASPLSFAQVTAQALSVLVASAAIAVCSASPAHALASGEANSVTVTYGDLDLHGAQGIQTLYQRISRAARHACGHDGLRDLQARKSIKACQADAVARAVGTVNHPALSALHNARRSDARLG